MAEKVIVPVKTDSGSPERVAYDLFRDFVNAGLLVTDGDRVRNALDLYARCLRATRGYRPVDD
jgi:hypothetical protein